MKHRYIYAIFVVFILCTSCRKEESGNGIILSKLFGGTGYDCGNDIINTADGGFAILASVMSSDGDVSSNNGSYDIWLLKTGSDGSKTWEKSYGGSQYDWGNAIVQSADGGYVMAGYTKSNDGDISGNHNPGTKDACIIKTDGNGTIVWKYIWGGSAEDVATDIITTSDGGFVISGYTYSRDGDLPSTVSSSDGFVLKLDHAGVKVWQTIKGGSSSDGLNSITQTNDGGFIAAGYTYSTDGDFSSNHGGYDGWVVRLDAAGNIKWQKLLGTIDNEAFLSVVSTPDHGFAAAGSFCNSSQLTDTYDVLLIKADSTGKEEWIRKPGGSSYDIATSLTMSSDRNIVLTGYTISTDYEPSSARGKYDILLISLGTDGSIIWEKRFGGSDNDNSSAVIEQSPGIFALTGFSGSNDGDLSGNHGLADCWLLKIAQ